MVGRYPGYAPTAWLYAANLILAALVSLRMTVMTEHKGPSGLSSNRRLGLMILIGVALLSVAVSFFSPRYALWIYVLNMVVPPLHGLWARKAV
jgi:hypothetical protein